MMRGKQFNSRNSNNNSIWTISTKRSHSLSCRVYFLWISVWSNNSWEKNVCAGLLQFVDQYFAIACLRVYSTLSLSLVEWVNYADPPYSIWKRKANVCAHMEIRICGRLLKMSYWCKVNKFHLKNCQKCSNSIILIIGKLSRLKVRWAVQYCHTFGTVCLCMCIRSYAGLFAYISI